MFASHDDFDVIPDMVIHIPCKSENDDVFIAVEVERGSKSKERLQAKLRKYSAQTLFDGLLYFCNEDAIQDRIQDVFLSEKIMETLRIKHYGANFMMFSGDLPKVKPSDFSLRNIKSENIRLTDWITYLLNTKFDFRRDSQFPTATHGYCS